MEVGHLLERLSAAAAAPRIPYPHEAPMHGMGEDEWIGAGSPRVEHSHAHGGADA